MEVEQLSQLYVRRTRLGARKFSGVAAGGWPSLSRFLRRLGQFNSHDEPSDVPQVPLFALPSTMIQSPPRSLLRLPGDEHPQPSQKTRKAGPPAGARLTRPSPDPAWQSAGSAYVNHNLQSSCARLLSSEPWLLERNKFTRMLEPTPVI